MTAPDDTTAAGDRVPVGARWRFLAPPATASWAPGPRPSFSVLVPAFQTAHLIGEAIDSALAQTEPAHEVIVVDDGSTDGLAGALARFAGRLHVIRTPHVGVSAARNLGLRHATGDFVAFLDADDAFEPEFLAALADLAAARPDLDILTADATFVVDGEIRGTFHDANPFPVDDQRSAVLQRCFITSKTAARRRRLEEIGGFSPALAHGEDWDCWIRLVLSGSQVGLVDAPLSRYRLQDGQTSARRAESLNGRYAVMASLLDRADLTEHERKEVLARLPALRLRAAVAAAREAPAAAARRRWWQVARLPQTPWRVRAAAAASVLAPGAVRLIRGLRR